MADNVTSTLAERILHHAHLMQPLLPTYIHLLVSAIFPIFIAAHASLTRPSSAASPTKKIKTDDDIDDDVTLDEESEPVQKIESLSPSDALLFPLLAGATLASLYFILKYLQDPAWLNYILGLYFSQLGLFFGVKFLKDGFVLFRGWCFPVVYSFQGVVYKVNAKEKRYVAVNPGESSGPNEKKVRPSPLPGVLGSMPLPTFMQKRLWSLRTTLYTKKSLSIHLQDIFTLKTLISSLDVLAITVSIAVVSYHTFIAKPWPLTNFLGFAFCYGALQYTTPTTAWTGSLILMALFVYDIYFVFFTPMMVTVATKLDVPIKLLFPRVDGCVYPIGVEDSSEVMRQYLICKAKGKTMAMLGLGDIVVPGMVMGFALRFDLFRHYLDLMQKKGTKEEKVPFMSVTGFWGERFWTATSATATPTSLPTSAVATTATDKIIQSLKARSFPKPYFYATVLGYLAGMIATVLVMQVWGHAQPALLYLVPGVLGGFWGMAVLRGEVGLLWGYTEAEDEEEGKKKGKECETEKEVEAQTTEEGKAISEGDGQDDELKKDK